MFWAELYLNLGHRDVFYVYEDNRNYLPGYFVKLLNTTFA